MPRRLPDIDPERCTGCGRCIAACAPHVLALERRGWEKVSVLLDAQGCTGCHHCAWRCPFEAIAMRSAPAAANPGAVHRAARWS
jgi:NAD-dependent dihydropyrimidine dehydrogenase PreA subunit